MIRHDDIAMDILVQPFARTVRAAPGSNLLEVLRAAGLPVSYSCLAGRCGTCRCRVLDGEVIGGAGEQRLPLAEPGMVLACQATLSGPCTVELPEPDEVVVHPARTLKATVLSVEDLAHDIKRLVLRPARPLEHSPGQYVQLQFGALPPRPYSMAGLASDGVLEFHVRHVPGGRISGHIAGALRPGDPVKVSGPLGCAWLRTRHTGPVLAVAGGTGLAPILSILRGALAQGMANPVQLYVGARTPRDLYGEPWLDALQRDHPALAVHRVVLSGGDPQRHRRGLVTEAIAADHATLRGWRAYLGGSPALVEAAAWLVQQRGLDPAHVHADAFYLQDA